MEIFAEAARQKLRFPSISGPLNTEDLWDLPLQSEKRTSLDSIAKGIYKDLKSNGDTVSFVTPSTTSTEMKELQLKLDVLKAIIDVRVIERDKAADAKARADKKQALLAIIADKEVDSLKGKSVEELRAMVEGL